MVAWLQKNCLCRANFFSTFRFASAIRKHRWHQIVRESYIAFLEKFYIRYELNNFNVSI